MISLVTDVPVIDVSALVSGTPARPAVAAEIGQACRDQGFFYVTGHGVDQTICDRLVAASRRFFALDQATKMQWRMSLGGRAWRGYFPAGGELTSGHPDWKFEKPSGSGDHSFRRLVISFVVMNWMTESRSC
jgi:polar amino acid transport system ATP-binding protein